VGSSHNTETKITETEFLKRSKAKHGDLFDYSLVKYKNTSTNIRIICHNHGVFEQTPKNHYRGSGCPKCAIETKAVESGIWSFI